MTSRSSASTTSAMPRSLDPPLDDNFSQPAEEIGERVMYRLCREIEEGHSSNHMPEIAPHKLIVRQSVAEPKI